MVSSSFIERVLKVRGKTDKPRLLCFVFLIMYVLLSMDLTFSGISQMPYWPAIIKFISVPLRSGRIAPIIGKGYRSNEFIPVLVQSEAITTKQ